MGKHRHKKSFYDVDEDELESSRKHRHHRRHSTDKHHETKQRIPILTSFNNSKIDDDQVALQSPPHKRQRSSSNICQSPSRILSQLIDDPVFLANAGSKAKEFTETARQLLTKPDLDATTQQIICAMAQAAVNVSKRLSSSFSSSSLTLTDQYVDDLSITNSTTYSSSTLLSPTLSSTSSSSTSTTPQLQQSHSNFSREETKISSEPDDNEDILIKQMIERAMKLTQQGDTRHAQHLLGLIHEKVSNKRKRTSTTNSNENEKCSNTSSNDFYSLPTIINEYPENYNYTNIPTTSPSEIEQSNDLQNTSCFTYPPAPPLPPPLPPPPLPESNSDSPVPPPPPSIPVPPIQQVQELLSNPSEVQDILKKLFGVNEHPKVSPPEEYQLQSQLTSSMLLPHTPVYPSSRVKPPSSDPPPYNSSIALLQGNRRNLPPLQTPDRCFSSSSNKSNKSSTHRTFSSTAVASSSSSSTTTTNTVSTNSIMPLLANPVPLTAPPLMKVNPTFSSISHPIETVPSRWSLPYDQQRHYHPFWCATCALGFPHQIAYQEHLRSHISCNIPGCSYTASEALVRIHHQNIHENNSRSRSLHQIRPTFHSQQSLEQPWPLMRM